MISLYLFLDFSCEEVACPSTPVGIFCQVGQQTEKRNKTQRQSTEKQQWPRRSILSIPRTCTSTGL
uniref:Testis cDNA clone: QtsA-10551, similar to human FLJ44896 protein (FLJ44896) n=1 Tax=Macaca fascicularis TaxID=9541 RepID=Q4R4E3_MACFA|nr:unnamed protein product [Macaca fascicularis]